MANDQKVEILVGGTATSGTNPVPVTPGATSAASRAAKRSQKTTITASTLEVTIITAGAAGVFNDLYGLILANTGASTTKVDIRDSTTGAVRATVEVPTLETRGFMLDVASALSQTTAANNWTAQCTTSTSSLEVTALFVVN